MGFFDCFKTPTQATIDYVNSGKLIEDLRRDLEKHMPPPTKYSIMRTTDMKWLYIDGTEVKWHTSSYTFSTFHCTLHNNNTKVFKSVENSTLFLKYNAETDTISLTQNPDEANYTVNKKDDSCVYYCSETYIIIYHPRG